MSRILTPPAKMVVRLIKLRNRLKRQEKKWQRITLKEQKDRFSSNRYEGIATGFRWSAEELDKLLTDFGY